MCSASSLTSERQRPIGTRVRLVQRDHEPPLTPVIAADAPLRHDRSGRPFPGRIRDLQNRALPAPRVVQKDEPSSMIEQRAEDVLTRLRSDQGPVSRVVQMVGPFVISEPPGERALLHR